MVKRPRTKARRIILAIIATTAVAVPATALVLYLTELQVAEYRTLAQAQAEGATERGWLPAFLPSSAVDIREVHDLDTNAQWLTFQAPPDDLRPIVHPFEELPYAEARRTALLRPWRVRGTWPPELSEPLLSTPRARELLGYYRTSLRGFCLAVEWCTGHAWAWSCAEPANKRLERSGMGARMDVTSASAGPSAASR